jgi:muramoyltetrapeptide carboxypeptidase
MAFVNASPFMFNRRVKDSRIARRDFLKRVGLTAPVFMASPSAWAKSKVPWQTHLRLIKPPRLQFGDTVGIVAPASPPDDPQEVDNCTDALKKLGFQPKLAPNVRKRLGFLAGDDQARASDLMAMFGDGEVKAIMCLRGGYGSARLAPMLDYRFIKRHAKIFVGFSDLASLHCAFMTHAQMVSFHGPTLNTNLTSSQPSQFTLESLEKTIMKSSVPGGICDDKTRQAVVILSKGVATGPLIGGNLSVLAAMMGTPFQPRFENAIFFFEDVDEKPYRFDNWLTQLRNAGLLQQVAGVAVGTNKNCIDPDAAKSKEYHQAVADVLQDRLLPLGVPVVMGLPFGHVRENATLPVGLSATLDGMKGDLIINEAAVL